MSLPFTRKEVTYLRDLVEQEKIRLLEDVSAMENRASHTEAQKKIIEKAVSKNFFKVESHIKKAKESVETLKDIERQLYE